MSGIMLGFQRVDTGSIKDIGWRGRRRRDSLNALEAGDAVRSSVLSLISSLQQKMNYPIMQLQHNSLSMVRQYTETSQQCKMDWKPQKLCLLCSYSQLDKHVSQLATSAINDDRHCWSGRDRRWFGRIASPASYFPNNILYIFIISPLICL